MAATVLVLSVIIADGPFPPKEEDVQRRVQFLYRLFEDEGPVEELGS
jgi:hypothetical protein